MSEVKSVAQLLEEELGARIDEMEKPDYEYVPKLNKADAIGVVITAVACIALIIVGII